MVDGLVGQPTGVVLLEHQIKRKVNILDRMMTGTVRKQTSGSKDAGKKTPVRKTKKKERKMEDVSGMVEMRNMMRIWTSKKRSRAELEEGDEQAHVESEPPPGPGDDQVRVVNVVNVEQSDQETVGKEVIVVDNKKETLVEKVRKKFDSRLPSTSSDPDQDYDSWKLRKEERKRILREQAGHVLLEEGGQCGGDGMDPKRLRHDSVSATGKTLKSKGINNQQCYSLLGEEVAGVQRDRGVQGGGGDRVQPVQLESDRQRATRMGGKFSRV